MEKQAQEARLLKKRKRAENEAKMRAEVSFPVTTPAVHLFIFPPYTLLPHSEQHKLGWLHFTAGISFDHRCFASISSFSTNPAI